ncbi:MAG: NAD(P)/FAD-dependent oxidoreductase [Treponemataceae bacterium]|nr:NAD(P)/FAD-dependent oxidoreductase [Treponemataceae bacterium]
MATVDIAIIGTGPAGLEAALTATVRNKSILLFGSRDLSQKVEKAHTVQNYLGLPAVSGEAMQKAFADHLASLNVEITEDHIMAVFPMGKSFSLQGHKDMYEAKTVILAGGMSVSKPFPGENENLGRGVSYCATCDGPLYRKKTAIIIGYSPKEESEAQFMGEIAEKVYYLPQYEGDMSLGERVEVLKGYKPTAIEKGENCMRLVAETAEGTRNVEATGIFILREDIAPGQLINGLAMEKNAVAVDRHMRASIPGVFAAGDITGAPYQYIKAAGEGNVAALSAVEYLANLNK